MNKKADNNAENQKLFKLSNKKLINIKNSNSNKKTSKNLFKINFVKNNKIKIDKQQRKSNSLDKFTKKFIEIINKEKIDIINIQTITEKMNICKRRIYDITNVLNGNSIYTYIIYFYIGIRLIKKIKNCQIQINPKFYEFYGNYIKYINDLKEKDTKDNKKNQNNKIKKSELTKINNDIKQISFFMDKINMDLSKRKSNKFICTKSNNNNIFLIIKDINKKYNLDFIDTKSKTKINNNSDIIKNPKNNIGEKKVDKKDVEENDSYDFIISSPSLKKIYDISNNNESDIESIIEKEGEKEKDYDIFFNNKIVNHKRKRSPSNSNF